MRTRTSLLWVVLAVSLVWQVCAVWPSSAEPVPTSTRDAMHTDCLVQISSFDHLSRGGYDGVVSVEQVRKLANFGIGTLHGLDGEMILLDGFVYHAPAHGLLRVALPNEQIPFATLTKFRSERTFDASGPIPNYAALQEQISRWMPDQQRVLAIKLRGRFETLRLRAPERQVKPYPVLSEALKSQAVFELEKVEGTLVGFRFPDYFGGVNAPGYHFHFVSADRKRGGHVLELSSQAIRADVEIVEQFNLSLEHSN